MESELRLILKNNIKMNLKCQCIDAKKLKREKKKTAGAGKNDFPPNIFLIIRTYPTPSDPM